MSDAPPARRYWNETSAPEGKRRTNGSVPVIATLIEKNGTLIRRPAEARQWTREHVLVAMWPGEDEELQIWLPARDVKREIVERPDRDQPRPWQRTS